MSASHSFLPWLRTGLAAGIARVDGTGAAEPRTSVAVTVVVDAAGERRPVSASLPLAGPGEIAGLDPRAVIRVAPRPGELNANPHELPMVEFGEPDLPWRFTPAVADARHRLHPWLVLAVLAAEEITDEAPASSNGRLPAITVASAAALPRLDQSWAWAHVQVDGFDPATETVATVDPRRLRARLLVPRRLAPKTTYTAVLVPAFARGRLAGLREPLAETVDGLVPAWQATDTQVRLPIYFGWSFQTGQEADFEQLARRLRPHRAGPTVGLSRMDARTPDPALPAAATEPLEVVGALVSPDADLAPWPTAEREAFTAELAALLNRPADALDDGGDGTPIVGPPLWGGWHAARDRLDPTAGAQPRWFHELNADPRLRVAAGLGAEVVRRNDEALMAAAWDQVEGILEANERLRRAQLAREISARLQERHLSTLDTDAFLQVTGPLHARFVAGATPAADPGTVAAYLAGSPIPVGALDGGLRRTRARVARMTRRAGGTASPLLDRLNRGDVLAAPPVPTPSGILAADLAPARLAGRASTPVRGTVVDGRAIGRASVGARPARVTWRPGTSDGDPRAEGGGHVPVPIGEDTAVDPVAERAAQLFQAAYTELFEGMVAAPPRPGPVLRRADLPGLATTLAARMDPRLTIAADLRGRLTIAPWVEWSSDDPLEPVMVAPEFDTPMYEPLRDLGQDWLLPGAGTIPSDAITLVVSNQRFVEAYLAGLNHEMARELLYHEYPTDQRGTYFRQFWDVRGYVDPAGNPLDPESTRDIRRMHAWPPDAALGANGGRTPPPTEGYLVLLIKAELFRRYPNTLVAACPAVIGPDGNRTLGETMHHAIFAGRLEPDIAFFGFDLTPAQARGSETEQGWFFVLAEHPTEPRFGLDADNGEYAARPTTWNDLNWAHTVTNGDDLDGLRYLDLDADLPDTTAVVPDPGDPPLAWHANQGLGAAGATGADLAWITLQRPFRVAIHAVDMLPAQVSP